MHGDCPLVLSKIYFLGRSEPPRFLQKLSIEWVKNPIKHENLRFKGNFFSLYVILQRKFPHSFRAKHPVRVGFRPLVFNKIATPSGAIPTRFKQIILFEGILLQG